MIQSRPFDTEANDSVDRGGRFCPSTRVVIVMGPSGCGKSTLGRALARRLRWNFLDADQLHSETSLEKMRRGIGLSDAERKPWLGRVCEHILRVEVDQGLVVACSALKRTHRRVLQGTGRQPLFVYLEVPPEVLSARLVARPEHFASAALLPSQLAALEVPHEDERREGLRCAILDGRAATADQVDRVIQALMPTERTP